MFKHVSFSTEGEALTLWFVFGSWIKWSGFKPWLGSLCCGLKQDTFSHSAPLSTQVCKNVLKDCQGNLITCRGIPTTQATDPFIKSYITTYVSATFSTFLQDSLRTGQRAKVRFRFIKQPEYIRKGSRIFFREGHTKGVGQVLSVINYNPDTDR